MPNSRLFLLSSWLIVLFVYCSHWKTLGMRMMKMLMIEVTRKIMRMTRIILKTRMREKKRRNQVHYILKPESKIYVLPGHRLRGVMP